MHEVGRQVIYTQGCFSRVRIWYAGHIKGVNGVFTRGWKGEDQTMVQKDIIMPVAVFNIQEVNNNATSPCGREDPECGTVLSTAA